MQKELLCCNLLQSCHSVHRTFIVISLPPTCVLDWMAEAKWGWRKIQWAGRGRLQVPSAPPSTGLLCMASVQNPFCIWYNLNINISYTSWKLHKLAHTALDKYIYHSGVVRCVKLGPRRGCLTMTADTQPGTVNSGCPGSRSRHTTSPNTGRLRLTRNRMKVDFPMPFPPHTTVHTASSTHTSMSHRKQHGHHIPLNCIYTYIHTHSYTHKHIVMLDIYIST